MFFRCQERGMLKKEPMTYKTVQWTTKPTKTMKAYHLVNTASRDLDDSKVLMPSCDNTKMTQHSTSSIISNPVAIGNSSQETAEEINFHHFEGRTVSRSAEGCIQVITGLRKYTPTSFLRQISLTWRKLEKEKEINNHWLVSTVSIVDLQFPIAHIQTCLKLHTTSSSQDAPINTYSTLWPLQKTLKPDATDSPTL